MAKHLYPAVFKSEEDGYSVSFPDFEGCYSEGDTMEEAYEMAIEALGLFLDEGFEINEFPAASNPKSIKLSEDEFVVMIEFDYAEYLKRHDSKAVKKTVSIPAWLNNLAMRENINFSNVLQNALMEKLDIA